MDRRNFIRLASLGASVGVVAPSAVLANPSAAMGGSGAGGLFYTKDAPGRWSKKVGGHLPQIEVAKSADGVAIQVVTPHEMKGFEHYIIKHVVLDQDYAFVAEKMFDPMNDKTAASEFSLGQYSGRVHVLSVCNKHDTWLNLADV